MLFMHSPGGPILSHYRINSPADEFKTLFICKWTLTGVNRKKKTEQKRHQRNNAFLVGCKWTLLY